MRFVITCPVCSKSCNAVAPDIYEFETLGTKFLHTEAWCFRSNSGYLEIIRTRKEEGLPRVPLLLRSTIGKLPSLPGMFYAGRLSCRSPGTTGPIVPILSR